MEPLRQFLLPWLALFVLLARTAGAEPVRSAYEVAIDDAARDFDHGRLTQAIVGYEGAAAAADTPMEKAHVAIRIAITRYLNLVQIQKRKDEYLGEDAKTASAFAAINLTQLEPEHRTVLERSLRKYRGRLCDRLRAEAVNKQAEQPLNCPDEVTEPPASDPRPHTERAESLAQDPQQVIEAYQAAYQAEPNPPYLAAIGNAYRRQAQALLLSGTRKAADCAALRDKLDRAKESYEDYLTLRSEATRADPGLHSDLADVRQRLHDSRTKDCGQRQSGELGRSWKLWVPVTLVVALGVSLGVALPITKPWEPRLVAIELGADRSRSCRQPQCRQGARGGMLNANALGFVAAAIVMVLVDPGDKGVPLAVVLDAA